MLKSPAMITGPASAARRSASSAELFVALLGAPRQCRRAQVHAEQREHAGRRSTRASTPCTEPSGNVNALCSGKRDHRRDAVRPSGRRFELLREHIVELREHVLGVRRELDDEQDVGRRLRHDLAETARGEPPVRDVHGQHLEMRGGRRCGRSQASVAARTEARATHSTRRPLATAAAGSHFRASASSASSTPARPRYCTRKFVVRSSTHQNRAPSRQEAERCRDAGERDEQRCEPAPHLSGSVIVGSRWPQHQHMAN